ncbi:MAG: L,D-transpeptidase family protein [Pseudomonadota bacterium]
MSSKFSVVCAFVAASSSLVLLDSAPAWATTPAAPNLDADAAKPASAGAEALRLALAMPGAASEEARTHYGSSAYRGLWFGPDGDDLAALALLTELEGAAAHGLAPSRYRVGALRAAIVAGRTGAPAAVAAAEVALTAAFLKYARDVSSGVLEPRTVDRELHIWPERPDELVLLSALRRAPKTDDFLRGLAPAHPEYGRLIEELRTLSAAAPDLWGDPVSAGRTMRLGETGPRIAEMRARLIAMGDMRDGGPATGGLAPANQAGSGAPVADIVAADPTVDPNAETVFAPQDDVFDEELEAAVRVFQLRHGLNDDGVAGPKTVKAMNATVEERIGQIIVNLERLRWLNIDLGRRHIYVNQADFTVRLVEDGQILFQERVVIGKTRKHRTPEFSDQMTHLVFNPTWHVPRSIATEEILPKLREDPNYLATQNMRLVANGGEAPDPAFTDWSLYSASDFPYRIKQRPGGANALGRVKFMFPNQFSIYLHDTPSKRLFAKDARAFSHGCVRVQDPMALARALLGPQSDEPASYVERILDREKERTVNLAEPVPVHLTYRTAWVDEYGQRQFRDDIYGRDARILAALRAAGVGAAVGG